MTVNLLGREITATIANLRWIDWTRLGINFAIVFAPGALEAAPQTHLAALYGPPQAAETVIRELGDQFPNLSRDPGRETLALVSRIIATIATRCGSSPSSQSPPASSCSAARSRPGIAAASTRPSS